MVVKTFQFNFGGWQLFIKSIYFDAVYTAGRDSWFILR